MNVTFIFPEYKFKDKSGKLVLVKDSCSVSRDMGYNMISILHKGDTIESDRLFMDNKISFKIENPSKLNWNTFVIVNKKIYLDKNEIYFYLDYKFKQVI